MTTPPTPADWYPDPEDPNGLRYFDGNAWTEHRAPAVAPAAPAAPNEFPAVRQATSGLDQPTSVITPAPADEPPTAAYSPPPPYEQPPSYEHATPGAPAGGSNKKVLIGVLGGVAAIVLVAAVVLVYFFVIKDDGTSTAAPASSSKSSSSTSKTTTSKKATETSATEATTLAPPPGEKVTDGDYTFSIADVEVGYTLDSSLAEGLQVEPEGVFYVVHINVANTGTAPLDFVATFQKLNAGTESYATDDIATGLVKGTYASIAPGEQAEVPVVFDVPDGTEADSILVVGTPGSAGVVLPLK